jgi:hypothetical protein
MRKFTEEEKATIWEDHQAGVPLKRIARTLGRENSAIRKYVGRTGGIPTRPRSSLTCGFPSPNAKRSRGAWLRGALSGDRLGPRAGTFDGVPGGERQRGTPGLSGHQGRTGGPP